MYLDGNRILIAELETEIRAALTMHRPLPIIADPVRCAAILAEEAGEVLKAALDLTRADGTPHAALTEKLRQDLRDEIRQTAAVAILWLVGLDQITELEGAENGG